MKHTGTRFVYLCSLVLLITSRNTYSGNMLSFGSTATPQQPQATQAPTSPTITPTQQPDNPIVPASSTHQQQQPVAEPAPFDSFAAFGSPLNQTTFHPTHWGAPTHQQTIFDNTLFQQPSIGSHTGSDDLLFMLEQTIQSPQPIHLPQPSDTTPTNVSQSEDSSHSQNLAPWGADDLPDFPLAHEWLLESRQTLHHIITEQPKDLFLSEEFSEIPISPCSSANSQTNSGVLAKEYLLGDTMLVGTPPASEKLQKIAKTQKSKFLANAKQERAHELEQLQHQRAEYRLAASVCIDELIPAYYLSIDEIKRIQLQSSLPPPYLHKVITLVIRNAFMPSDVSEAEMGLLHFISDKLLQTAQEREHFINTLGLNKTYADQVREANRLVQQIIYDTERRIGKDALTSKQLADVLKNAVRILCIDVEAARPSRPLSPDEVTTFARHATLCIAPLFVAHYCAAAEALAHDVIERKAETSRKKLGLGKKFDAEQKMDRFHLQKELKAREQTEQTLFAIERLNVKRIEVNAELNANRTELQQKFDCVIAAHDNKLAKRRESNPELFMETDPFEAFMQRHDRRLHNLVGTRRWNALSEDECANILADALECEEGKISALRRQFITQDQEDIHNASGVELTLDTLYLQLLDALANKSLDSLTIALAFSDFTSKLYTFIGIVRKNQLSDDEKKMVARTVRECTVPAFVKLLEEYTSEAQRPPLQVVFDIGSDSSSSDERD